MKKYLSDLRKIVMSQYAIVFLVLGIIYQCVMLGIYLPSYKKATDSIDQIKVAVINEDEAYGKSMAESLTNQLPCDVSVDYSLEEALNELDNLKLALVVEIPSNFTNSLKNGEAPIINYYEDGRQTKKNL